MWFNYPFFSILVNSWEWFFVMYSDASAVNWICKRKSKKLRQRAKKEDAWKEKEEKTDRKQKKKTGCLNECVEKRPGIGADTPHHTTVETLTSLLSVFPPAITLSLPPSLLPSICSATAPGFFTFSHSISSLLLLFPLLSSFLFLLCSCHLTLLLSPLFSQLNSSFSSVCLPQSIWQRLHLHYWRFWHGCLLPLCPCDFFVYGIKDHL